MIKKTKIYFPVIICLFIFLFFNSCTESSFIEPDPNVSLDSWIVENKSKVMQFDRETIGAYPRKYQQAILKELSPLRKNEIWRDKVLHILSLELTNEEEDFLKWYSVEFDKINYDFVTNEELEKSLYEKTIAGMKKFGWDKSFVHQLFFTIESVNDDFIQNRNQLNNISKLAQVDPGLACECKYDLACPSWDCDTSKGACDKGNANDDCGFFGNSDCGGICS
ncbi:bacteriocin fulvocin C-related protein [Lacinutrix mariniflava]|uniref:bacteriocin fulvocin C-related protein n=1 Tax=Lacinutrix mariniflava TaxID=342955 RepID=UPI0006E11E76|nr:bacteriocin fulvocin C-related protein [Lacinutrix mariniflava]